MTSFSDANYAKRSYSDFPVGYSQRPSIVVVYYQKAFTEDRFSLGGASLIMRGQENTAPLLEVARRNSVPIDSCYTAYKDEGDMPHWKIPAMLEQFRHEHPGSEFGPAIYYPDYDVKACKTGPLIFFQTPALLFFIRQQVDTVIVTGCTASGYIRASSIDSFQYGFRTIVTEDCVGDHEE